jgi:hypothetical protein
MSPVVLAMSPWGVVWPPEWPREGRLPEQDLGPPEVWSVTVQWPEAPKPRSDRAWRRAQRKRGGR